MAEEKKKEETGYQSQYQDQLRGIMQRISQRQPFNYDLNGDALYKQYADQYQKQGRMAMMDTMGQAQAMTGGYGNSYAQNVGQQAYNGYLQQMNNFIPELYQMALGKYQLEGDNLLNQYSMLSAQDATEYGRHRDQVADRQWQAEFDESLRRFNFANQLGEFAPVAVEGGSTPYYIAPTKDNDPHGPAKPIEKEQMDAIYEAIYRAKNGMNGMANGLLAYLK